MHKLRLIAGEYPVLSLLTAINVAVFLLLRLLMLAWPSGAMALLGALELPCGFGAMLARPWTLLTYMWVHADVWHLLFNMLCLWWFGAKMPQRFAIYALWIYIAGGVCGGLLYALAGVGVKLIGASASALAIAVAVTVLMPRRKVLMPFLGQINIAWITSAFVLMDVLTVAGGSPAGHVAHLGGAAAGAIGGWLMRRGVRPFRIAEPSAAADNTDAQIEAILAKVRQSGHKSLTAAERRILFKISTGRK